MERDRLARLEVARQARCRLRHHHTHATAHWLSKPTPAMKDPEREPVPVAALSQAIDHPELHKQSPITVPAAFVALLALAAAAIPSLRPWLLSGVGLETLLLALGYATRTRILPVVPTYALISTINLTYAICSTSWLLHILFAAACWPLILLTCLYQFDGVARLIRRGLRHVLKQIHFAADKIALFNIPALEIDTEVSGLLVIRGLTISLSSLTVFAHGIELGIKLSDEVELSIYADEAKVALFRSVRIGDCFASLKGGKTEMTFAAVNEKTAKSASIFDSNTPLLRASSGKDGKLQAPRPPVARQLTAGQVVEDSSVKAGLESLEQLNPDEDRAAKAYTDTLNHIARSSVVSQCRKEVLEQLRDTASGETTGLDGDELRAAICSRLHGRPSVSHPPTKSIRVTTLQNLSPQWVRRFLHRLPLLLRLLLAPLAHLHSISIDSITATGSGAWLRDIIHAQVFKHYIDENAELRRLARKMEGWLDSAFFVLELAEIDATAQVPIDTTYEIKASLTFDDVIAYRAILQASTPTQVVRLGGANAAVVIPSYLLPHHEHLIPAREQKQEIDRLTKLAAGTRSTPKIVRAQKQLERIKNDETCIAISGHASLPLCLEQELINFVAAFVKAAKVIEIEKSSAEDVAGDVDETELPTPPMSPTSPRDKLANLVNTVRQTTREGVKASRDGVKVAFVGGVINDRWIAKTVGKVAAHLENAQGDAGYAGEIPVPLEPYRTGFNTDAESKLLP